jgi:hypothetical protein
MGDDSLAFRLWVDGGDCANCCNNTDEFCNRCASTILICCNYHYFANVACMIHFFMYFVSRDLGFGQFHGSVLTISIDMGIQ